MLLKLTPKKKDWQQVVAFGQCTVSLFPYTSIYCFLILAPTFGFTIVNGEILWGRELHHVPLRSTSMFVRDPTKPMVLGFERAQRKRNFMTLLLRHSHITVTWYYGFDYTHLSCNLYILFLTINACELQLARRFFMILPFSCFYRPQFLWTEERLAFDQAIGDNVETACISFDIIPSKMVLSSISSLSRNMQDTWPIRDWLRWMWLGCVAGIVMQELHRLPWSRLGSDAKTSIAPSTHRSPGEGFT